VIFDRCKALKSCKIISDYFEGRGDLSLEVTGAQFFILLVTSLGTSGLAGRSFPVHSCILPKGDLFYFSFEHIVSCLNRVISAILPGLC
jgi:hypothetical protein